MQEIIRFELDGVNCYLLKKQEEKKKASYMLIDTGGHMYMDKTYTDRRKLLEDKLSEQGVTKDSLSYILLTHGDNDHACNAGYFSQKFECPIIMHKDDAFMVNNPDSDCHKLNANYQSLLFKITFKLLDKKINALMEKVYSEFESFVPDVLLDKEISLETFGFEGMIYHTPGHTKGSISIADHNGNLICGDIFSNMGKPKLSLNAMDFQELHDVAKDILGKGIMTVYPGHGEIFEAAQLKI